MPLISTGRPLILLTAPLSGVGLWMEVEGSKPKDYVWVVATSECLAFLDTDQPADQYSALDIAETNRTHIEAAASSKYDREGADPDNGEKEQKPILLVRSDDIGNEP